MSGFINDKKLPLRSILTGIAAAIAAALALTCLIALMMTMTSAVPYESLPYILLAADAAGVFIGAYIAAAIAKSRGLIIGLICGALMFVIFFFIGLNTGETVSIITLLRFFVLMFFGALGGIKGVNKKEKIRIK